MSLLLRLSQPLPQSFSLLLEEEGFDQVHHTAPQSSSRQFSADPDVLKESAKGVQLWVGNTECSQNVLVFRNEKVHFFLSEISDFLFTGLRDLSYSLYQFLLFWILCERLPHQLHRGLCVLHLTAQYH